MDMQQSVPAKSKFDNAILHWTAKKLPAGWQTQVIESLSDVVEGDDVIAINQLDADSIEIGVGHKTINLATKRSAGSISLGNGDWMSGLILLRLAKLLPVEIVDDKSNSIDRRNLKSLFIERNYDFSDGCYEDFATVLGVIPKLDSNVQQEISQFF